MDIQTLLTSVMVSPCVRTEGCWGKVDFFLIGDFVIKVTDLKVFLIGWISYKQCNENPDVIAKVKGSE